MKRLELEREITIDKPVKDVFAYVTDPKTLKDWRIGLIEHKQITPEINEKGSKSAEIVTILGKNFKVLQEILDYKENSQRKQKVKLGPITLNMIEDYQEIEGKTVLKVKGMTELKGIQQFFGTAILRRIGSQLSDELAKIKANLEA